MLSGEVNENVEKATLLVQHTFFVHFFAVVLHDYNVKLKKFLSYTFFGRNVVHVLVHLFFSLPLIFTLHWWPLAFLMLSPPLQISRCSSNKKMSPLLLFFYLSL